MCLPHPHSPSPTLFFLLLACFLFSDSSLSNSHEQSVTPSRIAENISVYDFTLTDDDMAAINALDRNFHFLRPNDWYQIPLFTA